MLVMVLPWYMVNNDSMIVSKMRYHAQKISRSYEHMVICFITNRSLCFCVMCVLSIQSKKEKTVVFLYIHSHAHVQTNQICFLSRHILHTPFSVQCQLNDTCSFRWLAEAFLSSSVMQSLSSSALWLSLLWWGRIYWHPTACVSATQKKDTHPCHAENREF